MNLTNLIVRPWGRHWMALEYSPVQEMYVFAGFGTTRDAAIEDYELSVTKAGVP